MKKLTKAISLMAGIITCSQTAIMAMYPSYEEIMKFSDSEIATSASNFSFELCINLKTMSPNQREERFYELVYRLSNKSQGVIDAAIQQETKVIELASRVEWWNDKALLEQSLNIVKNAVKTYKDSGKKINNLPKNDYSKMVAIITEITSICMFAELFSSN